MNKRNIIISILMIIMMFTITITIIPNYCYAATGSKNIQDGGTKKKDSKSSDKNKSSSSSSSSSSDSSASTTSGLGLGDLDAYEGKDANSVKLANKATYIFTILRTIGVVLSVVILIIIGIKYMLGSVEEKANYKETLLPYIIGAFLLFGGSVLPQIIYNFMQNF